MNRNVSAVDKLQSSEGFKKSMGNFSALNENVGEQKKDREVVKNDKEKIQSATIYMPLSFYKEVKMFFSREGFSFSKGTIITLDYIMREIQDGNLELTPSGFRTTLKSKIK